MVVMTAVTTVIVFADFGALISFVVLALCLNQQSAITIATTKTKIIIIIRCSDRDTQL